MTRRSFRDRLNIYSSAPDAPRSRRPTDGMLLALALVGGIILSFSAPGPTAIDTAVTDLLAGLPGLAGWFWEVTYDLLLVWTLFLLVVPLISRGRIRVFLDEVLAAAIAVGVAIVASGVGGTDVATSLRGLTNVTSPPIYLATRIAVATAVIVMASPHLARPVRLVGRWLIGIGAVSGIALGTALPIGVAAGFLAGLGSAALVHLLLGSPGGRLTLDQVTVALRELGVDATAARDAPLQRRGVALAFGATSDGRPIAVKVFGRDAVDGQFVASAWSSIWRRGARPLGVGRLEQVEHEAFLTLAAERGGVPVMSAIAAGETDRGDALLVLDADGRPFGSLAEGELTSDLLYGSWTALDALHELGISHGNVDAQGLILRGDGVPALVDLGAARAAASDGAKGDRPCTAARDHRVAHRP